MYKLYIIFPFCIFYCMSKNIKNTENDDYFKIEIGKELLNLELFNDEELALIPDQEKFNAIDHFVDHAKEKDELIGFEDEFIQGSDGFLYKSDYGEIKNEAEKGRLALRENNYNNEYSDTLKKALIGNNVSYEYDYDKFKIEYYNIIPIEPPNISNDTKTSNFSNINKTGKEEDLFEKEKVPVLDCNKIGRDNHGWKGIKCTWYEIIQSKNSTDYQNAGYRLGGILWFWFKIYAVIAVLLWIFKGWCCCCCMCKLCRTRELINEIKYFMINNPPGVIQNPDGSVSKYRPTNKEIETYTHLEKEIYYNV